MFSLEGWVSAPDVMSSIFEDEIKKWAGKPLEIQSMRETVYRRFSDFLSSLDSANIVSASGTTLKVGGFFLRQSTEDGLDHVHFSFETGLLRSITVNELEDIEFKRIHFKETRRLLRAMMRPERAILQILLILGFASLFIDPPSFSEASETLKIAYVALGITILISLIQNAYTLVFSGEENFVNFEAYEGFSVMFSELDVKDFLKKDEDVGALSEGSEKNVAKKIVTAFDDSQLFSRSEAKLFFGSHLTVRGFGRAWEQARLLRPELGKPGRKRRRD